MVIINLQKYMHSCILLWPSSSFIVFCNYSKLVELISRPDFERQRKFAFLLERAALQPGIVPSYFPILSPFIPLQNLTAQTKKTDRTLSVQTLMWTFMNFWLGFLAPQGLQPSVIREQSNLHWQTGPRKGNIKMSFLSFLHFSVAWHALPQPRAMVMALTVGLNHGQFVSKSQGFSPSVFCMQISF